MNADTGASGREAVAEAQDGARRETASASPGRALAAASRATPRHAAAARPEAGPSAADDAAPPRIGPERPGTAPASATQPSTAQQPPASAGPRSSATRSPTGALGSFRSIEDPGASRVGGDDVALGVAGEVGGRGSPPASGGFTASGAAVPTEAARQAEDASRAIVRTIQLGRDRERVEIRLDPPELGRIGIDLRLEDGGMTASVTAERAETLDLLRRHGDALQRELAAAGYERAALDFSDRRGEADARRGAAGAAPAGSADDANGAGDPVEAPHRPGPPPGWPDVRLDIRL